MKTTHGVEGVHATESVSLGWRDKVKIIILQTTVQQSWRRDAVTFMLIFAVIGAGWLLGSQAMQWCGLAILAAIFLLRRCNEYRASRRKNYLTPQQAADCLYARYGVRARGSKQSDEGGW